MTINPIDLAAALCWCLMSLSFVFTHSHVRRFNGICGLLVMLVFLTWVRYEDGTRRADAIALLTGLVLYWIGLRTVRTMLNRSVSLHLLVGYSSDDGASSLDAHIAGRLDDLVKYRLASTHSNVYTLARFGVAIGAVLAVLYRVMGVD